MFKGVDDFLLENSALIAAIVQVESSGDMFAARFEPHYSYLWNVADNKPMRCEGVSRPNNFPGIGGVTSVHTEFTQQRTSWGPMQVMGAVAREYGYRGSFAGLCGQLGIKFGARHLLTLQRRLKRQGHTAQNDLIAAYNAGSVRRNDVGDYVNQPYVNKVNAALATLNE